MHHSEENIAVYVDSLSARAKRLQEAKERLSLLIPTSYGEGIVGPSIAERAKERARLAKSEVAIRYWPIEQAGDEDGLGEDGLTSAEKEWADFVEAWCDEGSVRLVEVGEHPVGRMGELGKAWLQGRKEPIPTKVIPLTMLPDVWFGMSQEAHGFLGVEPDANRDVIEEAVVGLACKLARKQPGKPGFFSVETDLAAALGAGSIRALKVSAAELNPRYRGRVVDAKSGGERKFECPKTGRKTKLPLQKNC
jgi:hypothetical protein